MNELPGDAFHPATRSEWRRWLEENHATAARVWLVYAKKNSGIPGITYDEAVEEALCFGWIDSTPQKIDAVRFMQQFTPRKPRSGWSRLNKTRIEALTARNAIAPAGWAKIEAAKADGSWTLLDAIEDQTIPPDLQSALAADPTADAFFAAFSPSSKKAILWWIASAKRPETRQKRIDETVRLAAQNKKANQFERG